MPGLILGVTGRAHSGKDTIADILVHDHGFCKIAFADAMKRACAEWFNWPADTLWGPSEMRNQTWDRLGGLSARRALQLLGSDWGRVCYENVWVDYALRVADTLLIGDKYRRRSYTPQRGLFDRGEMDGAHDDDIRGVIFSDVRFPNEVDAIRAKGGHVWKTMYGHGLEGAAGAHVSESHIDSLQVDNVVPRCGLEALPRIVAQMLLEVSQ